MPDGATLTRDGVRVIQGTPTAPLGCATLFLRLWRAGPADAERTLASLLMARPGRDGYVVKELLKDLELEPRAALDQAVAIARRGGVAEIYVNADLAKLPPRQKVAAG